MDDLVMDDLVMDDLVMDDWLPCSERLVEWPDGKLHRPRHFAPHRHHFVQLHRRHEIPERKSQPKTAPP